MMETFGFFVSVIILQLTLFLCSLDAKYIYSYTMPSADCSSSIREIDGAVIYSANKLGGGVLQDTRCELRFTNADGTLLTRKRLALKFEQVSIADCHTRLMVFAGKSVRARLLQTLTCNDTAPTEIFEPGEAATIQLITGNADPKHYHFRLLITSYEKSGFCDELTCNNGRCISKDLACDSFDSCFDGSDELKTEPSNCKEIVSRVKPPPGHSKEEENGSSTDGGAAGGPGGSIHQTYVIPFEMWLIGLIIVIILLIIAIIICIICCIRRSKGQDAFGRPSSTASTTGGYQAAPSQPPGEQAVHYTVTEQNSVKIDQAEEPMLNDTHQDDVTLPV